MIIFLLIGIFFTFLRLSDLTSLHFKVGKCGTFPFSSFLLYVYWSVPMLHNSIFDEFCKSSVPCTAESQGAWYSSAKDRSRSSVCVQQVGISMCYQLDIFFISLLGWVSYFLLLVLLLRSSGNSNSQSILRTWRFFLFGGDLRIHNSICGWLDYCSDRFTVLPFPPTQVSGLCFPAVGF